jgi:hypothetical protein
VTLAQHPLVITADSEDALVDQQELARQEAYKLRMEALQVRVNRRSRITAFRNMAQGFEDKGRKLNAVINRLKTLSAESMAAEKLIKSARSGKTPGGPSRNFSHHGSQRDSRQDTPKDALTPLPPGADSPKSAAQRGGILLNRAVSSLIVPGQPLTEFQVRVG